MYAENPGGLSRHELIILGKRHPGLFLEDFSEVGGGAEAGLDEDIPRIVSAQLDHGDRFIDPYLIAELKRGGIQFILEQMIEP